MTLTCSGDFSIPGIACQALNSSLKPLKIISSAHCQMFRCLAMLIPRCSGPCKTCQVLSPLGPRIKINLHSTISILCHTTPWASEHEKVPLGLTQSERSGPGCHIYCLRDKMQPRVLSGNGTDRWLGVDLFYTDSTNTEQNAR